MYKLVVMYPQPDDPQAFIDYYESRHLPSLKALPGLVAASYGRIDDPASSWFVIFEALFADQVAMQAALQSDAGLALAKDIPNYSPLGANLIAFAVHELPCQS